VRYFEDLAVGDRHELGSETVTEAEIVEFAEQYDPQPIHVDPATAGDAAFGGLIASGWHTAAVTMRLLVDGFLPEVAATGALGVDDLRWRTPVRPGDELAAMVEIVGREDWDPRPDQGLVRARVETKNGQGEVALGMVPLLLVECQSGFSESATGDDS